MSPCLAACLLLGVIAQAGAAEVQVPGLSTRWNDQGALESLTLGELRYAGTPTAGLWIEEVSRGEPVRLAMGCAADQDTKLVKQALSELYFTLYNPGNAPAASRVHLDPPRLGLPADARLAELVEGSAPDASASITVPPRSLRVLQILR